MKYLLAMAAVALFALPSDAATTKEIVGVWKLDFTTPDDVKRTPTILIGRQHQTLVAWYVEKDKPEAFKEVRLKNDALLLTIRPEERRDATVTLEAKLKKDGTCFGTGTFLSDDGDTGTWEFKGSRMPLSELGDVETWNLSFVTPDGQQRKAEVTVLSKNEKLYGWYSSQEYELAAKKITIEGDKVVMSMTVKTLEGSTVDVTFRGTITGDRVAGQAEYDLEGETGSFSFNGRRNT